MREKQFNKILIGYKLRKKQNFRGKNKMRKRLSFRCDCSGSSNSRCARSSSRSAKGKTTTRVDLGPLRDILDFDLLHLQAEFARAL
ncbi:hypothetical protein Dimus_022142 [Dionaea muscipula]